ncbi:rifin PIR protein, putative [Plasmodium reichenowi]|uniref:Rifin PIR protein, putative n=1 Tax=Plasmodium reichenowi TaxID=5854 RepID=A0A2P9DS99_PLARE|nr:rifin PIR protein, putative [Plasmodium reichenowi]
MVYNKNKPYITAHHIPIYKSRVLSECDTQSSIHDKDTGMKSVMQQFVDRTSQRLREYDERMKEKRQKRKEERAKNIQKIIEKDKREKSLADKVEKGCLRCGCALGGGVLPVWGLVSGLWYATLTQHVSKMAIQKGIEAALEEGIKQIGEIFRMTKTSEVPTITVGEMLSSGEFTKGVSLFDMVKYINSVSENFPQDTYTSFFNIIDGMVRVEGMDKFNVQNGERIAAVAKAFEDSEALEFASHTSLLSNTIIASVVTILIIVLVMIIIYLILRYRRKKKMKKKAQYTKLLKE